MTIFYYFLRYFQNFKNSIFCLISVLTESGDTVTDEEFLIVSMFILFLRLIFLTFESKKPSWNMSFSI